MRELWVGHFRPSKGVDEYKMGPVWGRDWAELRGKKLGTAAWCQERGLGIERPVRSILLDVVFNFSEL